MPYEGDVIRVLGLFDNPINYICNLPVHKIFFTFVLKTLCHERTNTKPVARKKSLCG